MKINSLMSDRPPFDGFDLEPAELSRPRLLWPMAFYYAQNIIALDHQTTSSKISSQQKTVLTDYLSQFCADHQVKELCVFLRWDETDHCSECLEILYDIAQSLGILGIDHTLRVYVSTDMIDHCRPDSRFSFRSLPYFLIISWLQYWNTGFQWNSGTDRALYLSGCFTKIHRTALLNQISQSNSLRHRIEYTIVKERLAHDPDAELFLDQIDEQMQELDASWPGIVRWVDHHAHHIDLCELTDMGDFSYVLLPMDHLATKSLMLITETWPWEPRFITEKTFNAICLGMPFIIYNDRFARELQCMGFVTYQELLDDICEPDPEYTDNQFIEFCNEQMLRRVEKFLYEIQHNQTFVEKVQQVIDHNKRQARKLVLSHRQEYNSYLGLIFNQILQEQPPVVLR